MASKVASRLVMDVIARRKVALLELSERGELDLRCELLGMPPLVAASYANWAEGVEQLLHIGANRQGSSAFGGHAALGALLGAQDRTGKSRRNQASVMKACAETLSVLSPIGMVSPHLFAHRIHAYHLDGIADAAQRIGALQVAEVLREMSKLQRRKEKHL